GSNAYKKLAYMSGKFMFFKDEELTKMSLGTWNINIVDDTLDSSDNIDVNGMEKCRCTRNSYFLNNSSSTIPRRRNKRRTLNIVEPELCTIVEMADNRTMEELLQAPTEGYGEAIVILKINADHFEIKTNLLQLV
nr:reverse transcriptase domain-containing protein [Tanacetum cinerariifolium]